MPLSYCANPKCRRVLNKKRPGAYCSAVCEGQKLKLDRNAKRAKRREEPEKKNE